MDENTEKVNIRAKISGKKKVCTEGNTYAQKRNNLPQKMVVKEQKSTGA